MNHARAYTHMCTEDPLNDSIKITTRAALCAEHLKNVRASAARVHSFGGDTRASAMCVRTYIVAYLLLDEDCFFLFVTM